MLLKYKPVRIIQKFSVVAKTLDKMKKLYPNAIIESQYPAVSGYYKPGSVIDMPSKEEHGLFANLPDYLAVYIPQVDGFDDPQSGLARSRKVCWRGKQKWIRAMDGAQFEILPKKVKEKPIAKTPEIAPVIEEIKKTEPDSIIKSLDDSDSVKDLEPKKSKPKKSKSDKAKKPSQRKRKKEKEKLIVSDTDNDELDLHINEKDNEVIKSDE